MSQTQALLGKMPKPFDLLNQEANVHTYNILLAGTPGIGKTSLACQGPPPVILVDVEKGSLGLAPTFRIFPELAEPGRITSYRPESTSEVDAIFWEIRKGKLPCQTLVLDTATELQQVHLTEIRTSKAEDVNTQPDYNKNLAVMRKHFIGFRDLPINFVMITHVKEDKDEATGTLVLRPDLTPALASLARSLSDIIGYMKVEYKLIPGGAQGQKEEVRTLDCVPSKRTWAKNRVGHKKILENPTWNELINTK